MYVFFQLFSLYRHYLLRTHKREPFHLQVFLNVSFCTCLPESLSITDTTAESCPVQANVLLPQRPQQYTPWLLWAARFTRRTPPTTFQPNRSARNGRFLSATHVDRPNVPVLGFERATGARAGRAVMTSAGGSSARKTGRASGAARRNAESCCHGGLSVGFLFRPSSAASRENPQLGGPRGFCRRVGGHWGWHRRSLQD